MVFDFQFFDLANFTFHAKTQSRQVRVMHYFRSLLWQFFNIYAILIVKVYDNLRVSAPLRETSISPVPFQPRSSPRIQVPLPTRDLGKTPFFEILEADSAAS